MLLDFFFVWGNLIIRSILAAHSATMPSTGLTLRASSTWAHKAQRRSARGQLRSLGLTVSLRSLGIGSSAAPARWTWSWTPGWRVRWHVCSPSPSQFATRRRCTAPRGTASRRSAQHKVLGRPIEKQRQREKPRENWRPNKLEWPICHWYFVAHKMPEHHCCRPVQHQDCCRSTSAKQACPAVGVQQHLLWTEGPIDGWKSITDLQVWSAIGVSVEALLSQQLQLLLGNQHPADCRLGHWSPCAGHLGFDNTLFVWVGRWIEQTSRCRDLLACWLLMSEILRRNIRCSSKRLAAQFPSKAPNLWTLRNWSHAKFGRKWLSKRCTHRSIKPEVQYWWSSLHLHPYRSKKWRWGTPSWLHEEATQKEWQTSAGDCSFVPPAKPQWSAGCPWKVWPTGHNKHSAQRRWQNSPPYGGQVKSVWSARAAKHRATSPTTSPTRLFAVPGP